jgi:4-amino-4-deoxy-L-arabinose transferase-like glycosyltransferase
MAFLQDIIHRLEVGGGPRFFRIGSAVLAVTLLMVGYNWRAFRNFACQEAMDSAQLARNIAEGKGYTTLFIRPLSLHLVKERNLHTKGDLTGSRASDFSQIKGMHPDLANPPVYPVLLAGLMKVLPFRYPVDTTSPFWSGPPSRAGGPRLFLRYEPDFLIGLFNQCLFLGVMVLTFFLARRLFDARVAWLSGALLLGSELLWRFSVSGLSTMLLMLTFVALAWCMVLLDSEAREPKWGTAGVRVIAGAAGVVLGVGALTRYAFGWLILPVLLYLILFGGRQRVVLALIALAMFLGTMAPWLARNYSVSGTPFGTAGFSVMQTTVFFPENRLERSLEPDLSRLYLQPFWTKLMVNLRQIVQGDLPKLGGSWVTAFFLAGLMIGFRNLAVRRLRYFLVGCLVWLVFVQALGRTQLSDDSPEINSENLLVLLSPLVLVYGVSLFFLLLDLIELPFFQLRYLVIGLFSTIACLPLILVFLPPKPPTLAYPPYYPPAIQTIAGWLKEKELAMSDVPWAMAWYGRRQSVWLTLKCTPDAKDPTSREDFFAINDYQKPINILYLTPMTMDSPSLSRWMRAGEHSWGVFILESLVKKKVPDYFPLNESQSGWMPEQLVLADWQRWRKTQ